MPYFDVKLCDALGNETGEERIEVVDEGQGDLLAAARVHAEHEWGPTQIASVSHALVCRSCGQAEFKEWTMDPYYNYVEITGVDEHGDLVVDYPGISGSGDGGGDNPEFWCRNCDDHADSLEELCGLPLVVNRACPQCGSDHLSAKIILRRYYQHVAVLSDGDVFYEGFGEQVEDKVDYLECDNGHTFQPTEHRLPATAVPAQ